MLRACHRDTSAATETPGWRLRRTSVRPEPPKHPSPASLPQPVDAPPRSDADEVLSPTQHSHRVQPSTHHHGSTQTCTRGQHRTLTVQRWNRRMSGIPGANHKGSWTQLTDIFRSASIDVAMVVRNCDVNGAASTSNRGFNVSPR